MFNPETYASGIRRLNQKEQDAITVRLAEAKTEALRLASEIRRSDPKVKNVFLFGSVATGLASSPYFDIDLAIDGGDCYAAMDIAATSAFKVDIVSLSLIPESVRNRILTEGITL